MDVIVIASRKGGSGKSTLTANLAAAAHKAGRRCLLIDTDPQGSLTLWHTLRGTGEPALKSAQRGVAEALKAAAREGYDLAFVDTAPTTSTALTDALKAATLVVIPARPSVFDLAAVEDTIEVCRELKRPYAVVLNGAPARREDADAPLVAEARRRLSEIKAPVWGGQITHRTAIALALGAGEGAREFDPDSQAAAEMARLWAAVDKSVKAIHGHRDKARGAMHRLAA